MRVLVAAAFGLFALCGPALADDPAAEARRFAHEFAVPRFEAVAKAAHAQADAWASFCASGNFKDTAALKAAFNDLGDAWARVEFVRIGPAATALRVERFNWWLDRTGATAKALDAMLAAADAPAPDKLASGSVAGQGLPVIERLLYDAPLTAQRCAVGTAVARGQAAIADAIVTDWTATNGAAAALDANARWNMSFADAREAASVMMTDLAAGLEGLKDLKVAMLLHDAQNPKAPRLAEGVRSARSWRDVELNLAAIREGLVFFLRDAPAADKLRLDAAFDDAQGTLKLVANPKLSAKDRIAAINHAHEVFASLSQTAIAVLPEATGLTLGFNNLDGD
jgi:predicted lipoprotein